MDRYDPLLYALAFCAVALAHGLRLLQRRFLASAEKAQAAGDEEAASAHHAVFHRQVYCVTFA